MTNMDGPGLFVDGIFIKLEEDIDDKKNVTPFVIKREESDDEKWFQNIYTFLKKNIVMNFDVMNTEVCVFNSKLDYLNIPPMLNKKCKDRHLELLKEIEKQFELELTDYSKNKKELSAKKQLEEVIGSHKKEPTLKLKDCFVKLEKLKFAKTNNKDSRKLQKCPKCNKTFSNMNNFANHLRLHSEKLFKCSICDQKFYSKNQCKYHEAIHTISEPFPCEYCGLNFSMRKYLHAHLKFNHSDKFFRCTFCDKKFRNVGQLESHTKIHAAEKSPELMDGYCSDSVKPFSCDTCGKNFSGNGPLNNHMRVHMKVKSYQYEQCKRNLTKSFNSVNNNFKTPKKGKDLIGQSSKVAKPIIKIEKIDLNNYIKKGKVSRLKMNTRNTSRENGKI